MAQAASQEAPVSQWVSMADHSWLLYQTFPELPAQDAVLFVDVCLCCNWQPLVMQFPRAIAVCLLNNACVEKSTNIAVRTVT